MAMRWVLGWLIAGVISLGAAELPIFGIAEVGFRVSDADAADRFYGDVLRLPRRTLSTSPVRLYDVNTDSWIVLEPGLTPGEDIRLTYIALRTTKLPRLRTLLIERGLQPSEVTTDFQGRPCFWLTDPDGHRLKFVEVGTIAVVNSKGIPPISRHILHAGVTVSDLDRALAFYGAKLGFVEFWRGGRTEGEVNWVNLRFSDHEELGYIELMLHSGKPSREQYGSMHHICLAVPSIQQAYQTVLSRGVSGERHKPRIGRNKRWQLNLFDPDGSRIELMEPRLAPESSQP